jgi:hypothetical protein
MNQHRTWLQSDPPGVVFQHFGGARAAEDLADRVSAGVQLDGLMRGFKDAFDLGIRESRWGSLNEMASFLGVDRNWLGRLLRGDSNVASMKIGDLSRCAGVLQIHLGIAPSVSPECIERHVLHGIVQKMREQRFAGNSNCWPDLKREDEVEEIRRCAWQVGYICDPPARETKPWQKWLTDRIENERPTDPKQDTSARVLSALSLGDWLVVRPYLNLFDSSLYIKLRALDRIAKRPGYRHLQDALLDFVRPLAQAQELLNLFRRTKNRTVEEVAQKRNWHTDTVRIRLRHLKLVVEDFRGDEAALGRLIIRSPVLRCHYDILRSQKEWSAGSIDAPQEGRVQ